MILHKRFGDVADVDPVVLDQLTYLIESGSDRLGALDGLVRAVERLEAGIPFSAEVDEALVHGSSVGGARPKALLSGGGRRLIAKFSSTTDPFPVVKAEAVALNLARRAGLDAAQTEVVHSLGPDVLLVQRFDRVVGSRERRMIVSALMILGLDEIAGRYATYWELADIIRERFTRPAATLRELFARITFNILCGNTDDHARNHAPSGTVGCSR